MFAVKHSPSAEPDGGACPRPEVRDRPRLGAHPQATLRPEKLWRNCTLGLVIGGICCNFRCFSCSPTTVIISRPRIRIVLCQHHRHPGEGSSSLSSAPSAAGTREPCGLEAARQGGGRAAARRASSVRPRSPFAYRARQGGPAGLMDSFQTVRLHKLTLRLKPLAPPAYLTGQPAPRGGSR